MLTKPGRSDFFNATGTAPGAVARDRPQQRRVTGKECHRGQRGATQSAALQIGALVMVCLLLAACVVPGPTPLPERGDGIVVIDALGRSVEFDEPPQRIVVAGKSSLTIIETLYLFPGVGERIVGVTAGQQDPGDFLNLVDPTFEEKARLAPEAGPEQIAPLKPAVVIARSFMAETLGKALEQVGIPVVYVDLETPEQYMRDVITLGQLLGSEPRAGEIHSFYQSHLDYVDNRLEGLEPTDKPTVLVLQYNDKGGQVAFNVPSASWIQTAQARLAGGQPIWEEAAQGGGWTVVNFEQIAAWNPSQIFVIHYGADSAGIVDKLRLEAQWQALPAVQKGDIYGFAADIYSWDQPDPRWILGVTWLAGKVHPGRFEELDIMAEVSAFFEQMYGLDQAAIKTSILPALRGDVP